MHKMAQLELTGPFNRHDFTGKYWAKLHGHIAHMLDLLIPPMHHA